MYPVNRQYTVKKSTSIVPLSTFHPVEKHQTLMKKKGKKPCGYHLPLFKGYICENLEMWKFLVDIKQEKIGHKLDTYWWVMSAHMLLSALSAL